MNFLDEIIAQKKARLASAKKKLGADDMRARAFDVRQASATHRLRAALSQFGRLNIIAEVKRASPSKGMIRANVDVLSLARLYELGGAAAISVLTEEDRFLGSLEDLRAIRAMVKLPLLRKDFIFDEYQLYEAAAAGADALLLIVAALADETLFRLLRITEDELGMDALVEVHSRDELQRAHSCGATLIGVNNRDLRTFNVSLETSVRLIQGATSDMCFISESGLSTSADLQRLRALGYKGFLIGETLMRAEHPEEALRALLNEV
jgi:indole-3-glycerol phosphate synthase